MWCSEAYGSYLALALKLWCAQARHATLPWCPCCNGDNNDTNERANDNVAACSTAGEYPWGAVLGQGVMCEEIESINHSQQFRRKPVLIISTNAKRVDRVRCAVTARHDFMRTTPALRDRSTTPFLAPRFTCVYTRYVRPLRPVGIADAPPVRCMARQHRRQLSERSQLGGAWSCA